MELAGYQLEQFKITLLMDGLHIHIHCCLSVNGIVSIRFRAESGGATNDFYNDILVDNLAIREAPTCPSPLLSFGVNNLSANSDLNWLAGGNELPWGLEWDQLDFH